MMNRLEGRNLAHPGCLIGVTLGLTIGIVAGGILAAGFNVPFRTVSLIWLAITLGLGLIGWLWGAYLTTKKQLAAMRTNAAGVSDEKGTIDTENQGPELTAEQ